jgi:hypothetical protein
MKHDISEQELLERLGALPREIVPDRDVWPAISKVISHKDTGHPGQSLNRWWKHAVAASLAVVFVTGILIGQQWSTTPGLVSPEIALVNPDRTMWVNSLAGTLTASELEYQAAFREFISVGESQEFLPQETVNKLITGWADLGAAEAALTSALQENPGNSFLTAKMLELRSRQLNFLKQIASLDQNARRTTI